MSSDRGGMVDPVEFRLNGDAEAVRAGLRLVVMAPPLSALSPLQRHSAEIVLAEVLNNIVEHAYGARGGGPVDLALCHAGGTLRCRIEDCGRPMPQLSLPESRLPPTAVAVGDLAEGGWGWSLVRGLTEDLTYVRDGDRNRLTFRIPLDVA